MTLHRVVALLLVVSVTASSVEVVFGGDVFEATSISLVAPQVIGSDASQDGAEEDCACLCACLCSGAQLVVEPPALAGDPLIRGPTTAPPTTRRGSATLPFPPPPERPPLAA